MGVGGKFWDLLKPYGRHEGSDYLREKRVAVDLSFWIIQHETAVKGLALKPHLRLTFFRTINLFSKFGAYPVFVVDGTPSPLKSQTRISRFYRSSGIDTSNHHLQEGGVVSVERNKQFCEWVSECVELLKLLGIPVLKAKGEAEALCAQLNSRGFVDACITPDSDAFLFGATSVIKSINPNSTEPFECYHMSDIEAGLGLKRRHLIAISLFVGNDFDSGGVLGIGVDKALRIVRAFSEDEILQRLEDIGKGLRPEVSGGIKSVDCDDGEDSSSQVKRRLPHCSRCGHPGSKRAHFKSSCEHCSSDSGCVKKPLEFICECSFCSKDRELKQQKKTENWWVKVCDKIALGPDFPNRKIIQLYLSDIFTEDGSSMSWGTPDTEMLVDCLVFNLHWDPSYVRKMLLPMLSTIYLRERARNNNSNTGNPLLCDQYEFHSIKCMKTRYGHKSFVIRWRKPVSTSGLTPEKPIVVWEDEEEEEVVEEGERVDDPLDGLNEPRVQNDNGECFLLTDECIGLVQSAFPEETEHFLQEKKLLESKKKNVCEGGAASSSTGAQKSITDFYRSTKAAAAATAATPAQSIDTGTGSSIASAEKKRQASSSSFSKSTIRTKQPRERRFGLLSGAKRERERMSVVTVTSTINSSPSWMKNVDNNSPSLRETSVYLSRRSSKISLQRNKKKKVCCGGKSTDDDYHATLKSLNSRGRFPRKSLGQHYMLNSDINDQLAAAAKVKEGDFVLEIGPGTGSLTNVLLNLGASVLAIDKDPHMVDLVRERFQGSHKFKVLHEDFVKSHIRSHMHSFLKTRNLSDPHFAFAKVVSNLPFNISTDVVKLLLPMGDIFSHVVLLLQDEAALRLVEPALRTSEYRPINILVNFYSEPEYNFRVPRENFFPQPKVDAAVVTFKLKHPRDYPDVSSTKSFFSLVNSAFNGKRKMLRKSLQHLSSSPEIEKALGVAGLPVTSRPEELTLGDFVKLHNVIGRE
ncbi:Flap endonuclease GEN-like 1 [Hirschfeldia incana]|nr:Flap endonuclease GEN-like 1 [Hirschfeldia incana]